VNVNGRPAGEIPLASLREMLRVEGREVDLIVESAQICGQSV
jgi:hypothetical protein